MMIHRNYPIWFPWVLVVVGVSDWLDGFLARKLQAQTRLGGVLDPFADKVVFLGLSVYSVWESTLLPLWYAQIVLLRHFVPVICFPLMGLLPVRIEYRPGRYAKVACALTIGCLLLAGLDLAERMAPVLVFSAFFEVVFMHYYPYRLFRVLNEDVKDW